MKSQVTELLHIASCIYQDAVAKCTADVRSDWRDLSTIRSRTKHEGLSFLTITLPSYGLDFERSLAIGRIDSSFFRSFGKVQSIPSFLKGMISHVFDPRTGLILDEPCLASIEGIRQICHAFKKVEVPCSPEKVRKAFRGFIECEQDLSVPLTPGQVQTFTSVSDMIWTGIIASIDVFESRPKHGPGATAEGISGNQKYEHAVWHDRLEPYFPVLSNAYLNESVYDTPEFERVAVVSETDEQPVRVITVPKTLKSPRIIAIEPVCMQYTQQALSRELVRAIEGSPLTRGHVNFTDQTVNQDLAITASSDGKLATLDLSSASDRVPLTLALNMFDSNPSLRDAIYACRSKRAQLPSGEVIHLRKFASMGSALCFPVESMYFYTLCVIGLLRATEARFDMSSINKVSRLIYVYGDDIIVPTDYAETVCTTLQEYYCKVNTTKSFWTGKFRESCGMDAFNGEPVKPVYLRQIAPTRRKHVNRLVSWVDTSNQFYMKGYWRTASHLQRKCEHILGRLPIVHNTCAGLGWISYTKAISVERQDGRYQRPEVRTWIPVPVYKHSTLEGYAALTKCLLNLEDRPLLVDGVQDSRHLERVPRHGAVALKRRWTCVY